MPEQVLYRCPAKEMSNGLVQQKQKCLNLCNRQSLISVFLSFQLAVCRVKRPCWNVGLVKIRVTGYQDPRAVGPA